MKIKFFLLVALSSFILVNTLRSDDDQAPLVELFVKNSQATPLYIKYYPISSTFTRHCDLVFQNSDFRQNYFLEMENRDTGEAIHPIHLYLL